jgi:hypothetical protein
MADDLSYAGLSSAAAHPNGEDVVFRVERADGESFEIACTLSDLAELVAHLIELSAHCRAPALKGHTKNMLTPIPTVGMGFAVDTPPHDADHSLLVMRTAGLDLPFRIASNGLVRLADDIAKVAQALAAPTATKN